MIETEVRNELGFKNIVGQSNSLRRVLDDIAMVAPTDSTVLVYGETGTGKEMIARAVHDLSARNANAFVRLNCAAIPVGLLESELFGHEKGAFTGAIAQRLGRFEVAHRGTIFLDEIGEIPLELQPKLLRVLQEREFERLGSTRTVRTDARLIAATNCDLKIMVDDRKFRSDLYYRLNVFPIRVPPLRERVEDIPLLVRHFVAHFSATTGSSDTILPETMEALTLAVTGPAISESLQNVIERAVIITKGATLTVSVDELKPEARLKSSQSCEGSPGDIERRNEFRFSARLKAQMGWLLERMERPSGWDKMLDASLSNGEIRHLLDAHFRFRNERSSSAAPPNGEFWNYPSAIRHWLISNGKVNRFRIVSMARRV